MEMSYFSEIGVDAAAVEEILAKISVEQLWRRKAATALAERSAKLTAFSSVGKGFGRTPTTRAIS